MRLSTKIYVGCGIPVGILAAISAFTYVQTSKVAAAARLTSEESAVYAALAQDMKLDVVQVQQWLTDISATQAAPGYDDGFGEAENHAGAFRRGLASFREMFQRENDRQSLEQIDRLGKTFEEYYQMGQKMAQAYIDGGPTEGNKIMGDFDPFAAAMTESVDAFVDQQMSELDQSMQDIVSQAGRLRNAVWLAALGAVAFSIVTSLFTTRSITRPLKRMFQGLKTFSTAELQDTAGTFTRIIDGMTDSVSHVSDAAEQVSTASQQSAEGASEQASSLEESSAALEQMTASTRTTAGNAKDGSELASQVHAAAQEGDKAMAAINESSGEISKIIKVIEEIAFQTNLLALNAAVEAARAGEHGKGFAVVADEVRNLAQRAAQAAGETTGLISEAVSRSKQGTQAINGIADGVAKVTELLKVIAQANEQQAKGVEQVNSAVSQMDKVTQRNASSAEESAAAAEELRAQATGTKALVGELMSLLRGTNSFQTGSPGGHTAFSHGVSPGHSGPATSVKRKSAADVVCDAQPATATASDEFLPPDGDGDLQDF